MITFVYPAHNSVENFIPIGIASLGAFLKEKGYEVNVIDMRLHSREDLIKAAKASEFIGFSVMTLYMSKALEYAALCKQHNPATRIVFGGPHPTIAPEETLKNKQIDFIVLGEGEKTLLDLIENYSSLQDIKGIAYRQGDDVKINSRREFIQDLDGLPFPARDLFPIQKIFKKHPFWPSVIPYPEISMISTRGCPYNCIFCQPTLRLLFGNKVRKRSAVRTVDEMEFIYRRYNPPSIFMADDLFTQDQDWALDVCAEIRKRNLPRKLIWSCECRVNTFNEKLAKEFKNSGCYMIWFGVESYSQNVLNTLRKGTKVRQNIEALKIARENKLITLEQIMISNYNESLKELRETERFSRAAKADVTVVAITTPMPGTDLYDLLKKNNLLLVDSWDELGSRFKGKEKFKLLYSQKELDQIYERLRRRGEISLRLILTRDYYRKIIIKRMICHLKNKNFMAGVVDLARIVYGALPFWLYLGLKQQVSYFKRRILS